MAEQFDEWLEKSKWWDKLLSSDAISLARDAWNAALNAYPRGYITGSDGKNIRLTTRTFLAERWRMARRRGKWATTGTTR